MIRIVETQDQVVLRLRLNLTQPGEEMRALVHG